MKNTILKTCSILLLCSLFFACKSTKKDEVTGFENEYFGIKGISCIETVNPDAIDSYVGNLECDCVTFNYDYGRYSNQGPLTKIEEFRNSFDAYHHIKFFKNRMIDPKVNKLFLDSVQIIDVRRKLNSDDLIFDCDACNATAELIFKKSTFLFPFTMNAKQLDAKELDIDFSNRDMIQYKFYQDHNSNLALYAAPEQNRFKKKNCLSLTVKKSECSKKKIDQILHSVYLKQETR